MQGVGYSFTDLTFAETSSSGEVGRGAEAAIGLDASSSGVPSVGEGSRDKAVRDGVAVDDSHGLQGGSLPLKERGVIPDALLLPRDGCIEPRVAGLSCGGVGPSQCEDVASGGAIIGLDSRASLVPRSGKGQRGREKRWED